MDRLLTTLLVFMCGCATEPALRLLPVPESPAVAERLQNGELQVQARGFVLLPPPTGASLPPEDAERRRLLADLAAGESLFWQGQLDEAGGALAAAFEVLKDHPELLPSSKDDRAKAYGALLVLFRLRAGDETGAAEIAAWLASHMPDQDPSVQTVPPELEARLSNTVIKSRTPGWKLGAAGDVGRRCSLLVDGLESGTVPVHGLPVTNGAHRIWSVCGAGEGSLVAEVSEARTEALLAPLVLSRLKPCGAGLCLSPALEEGQTTRDLSGLGRQFGADAALLVGDGRALLAPANGRWLEELQAGENGVEVFRDPPGKKKRRLVALGAAAATAFFLGSGVYWNLEHNDDIARTSEGWADLRQQADSHKELSMLSYGMAAVSGAMAAVLFLWDLGDPYALDPEESKE